MEALEGAEDCFDTRSSGSYDDDYAQLTRLETLMEALELAEVRLATGSSGGNAYSQQTQLEALMKTLELGEDTGSSRNLETIINLERSRASSGCFLALLFLALLFLHGLWVF